MNANNSPALIAGHDSNKKFGDEMAKVKLICVADMPYSVGKDSVKYGDIFEIEEGIDQKLLLGNGRALIASDENIKEVKEKLGASGKTNEKKNNK